MNASIDSHARRLFDLALNQHRRGDLASAREACVAALTSNPHHAPSLFVLGVIELQLGHLQHGMDALSRSLTLDPNQPQALANLGAAHNALGQHPVALTHCERALQLAPALPLAAMHRGVALRALGRHIEAVDSLRQALHGAPNDLATLEHLGKTLVDLGRHEEAIRAYEGALSLQPRRISTQVNLGIAYLAANRSAEALGMFERATQAAPHELTAHYNRGLALLNLERLLEALTAFDAALRLDARCVDARNARAVVLGTLGRWREAITDLNVASTLSPARADIVINLARAYLALHGTDSATQALRAIDLALRADAPALTFGVLMLLPAETGADMRTTRRLTTQQADQATAVAAELRFLQGLALQHLGQFDSAVASYRAALALLPAQPHVLNNLGALLITRDQFAAAHEIFRRLQALEPDYPYVAGHLHAAASTVYDWDSEKSHALANLEAQVLQGARACLPFWFLSISDRVEAQLECARTYLRHELGEPGPLTLGTDHAHTRLRVGYLSGDFREHAVAFLMSGVWESHDRSRFETYALSLMPSEEGPYAMRVRRAMDHFIDLSAVDDAAAATRIAELSIDVLIDLSGHTLAARPGILAHHPARVQVNYLGYPGTSGAPYVEYLIADDNLVPEDARPGYSENIVYLPHCFQANDSQRVHPRQRPSRAEAGLPDAATVLCCFNNAYKINAHMFSIWMRLLQATPNGILWLVANSESAQANLRREAQRHAVAPERLIFAKPLPYEQHLARIGAADLFLDTVPFNGGTTVSDALWAGIPVLTCSGEAMAARMAGSLLRCVGVPELVTTTLQQYEQRGLELLSDPQALAALRTRIEHAREHSPLFDTARFTRHFEAALSEMHCRYIQGLPASDIHVAALD